MLAMTQVTLKSSGCKLKVQALLALALELLCTLRDICCGDFYQFAMQMQALAVGV
jgi:hypothetical protein